MGERSDEDHFPDPDIMDWEYDPHPDEMDWEPTPAYDIYGKCSFYIVLF